MEQLLLRHGRQVEIDAPEVRVVLSPLALLFGLISTSLTAVAVVCVCGGCTRFF